MLIRLELGIYGGSINIAGGKGNKLSSRDAKALFCVIHGILCAD